MKFTYDEEIAAEAQQAWKVMREFSAIERAALAEKVEMEGEGVGSYRHMHMPGGTIMTEKLVARDDDVWALTYIMTARGPMPLESYQASMRIEPAGEHCRVIFEAEYEPRGITEEKANRMLTNVYRALIDTARRDLNLA